MPKKKSQRQNTQKKNQKMRLFTNFHMQKMQIIQKSWKVQRCKFSRVLIMQKMQRVLIIQKKCKLYNHPPKTFGWETTDMSWDWGVDTGEGVFLGPFGGQLLGSCPIATFGPKKKSGLHAREKQTNKTRKNKTPKKNPSSRDLTDPTPTPSLRGWGQPPRLVNLRTEYVYDPHKFLQKCVPSQNTY